MFSVCGVLQSKAEVIPLLNFCAVSQLLQLVYNSVAEWFSVCPPCISGELMGREIRLLWEDIQRRFIQVY